MKHIKVVSPHGLSALTEVFIDGQKATDVTFVAFTVHKGVTHATLTFAPVSMELDSDAQRQADDGAMWLVAYDEEGLSQSGHV